MPHETFRGSDLPTTFALAHARFGEDAFLLSVRRYGRGPGAEFEIVASDTSAPPRRARPSALPPPTAPRRAAAPGAPLIVAVVGPTGAGKTTTTAKLAGHSNVFSGRRVGVLCLDTHRVGAAEQSALHALALGLDHAVAYDERGLTRARRAMRRCDVILVDTAGRGPARDADDVRTAELLSILAPVETHLALPAGLEREHARRIAERYRTLGATHLLTTKLDEAPEADDYAALARDLGLGRRWVANGQDVPGDLHGTIEPALPRRRERAGREERGGRAA